MKYTIKFITYFLCISLAILGLFPFWVMIINATRSTSEILQGFSLTPSHFLIDNYQNLTGRGFRIFYGFVNSLTVSGATTLLSLYVSSLTAYALYIYQFKGQKVILVCVLLALMISPQLSLIGFYQFMLRINLVDSYWALILPAIANPGSIFFLLQYLRGGVVSKDLVAAGRIDGANEFRIFNQLVIPIMVPAIMVMAIFTFIASWNSLIAPLMLLNTEAKYTLPMLVQSLKGDIYRTEFGSIYLGITMSIIPLLIFFLFFSKFMMRNIAIGGIKE